MQGKTNTLTRRTFLYLTGIQMIEASGATAQPDAAKVVSFDVASIKLLDRIVPGQRYGDLSGPGRVFYRTTLRHMVKLAWLDEPDPLSEPPWFGSQMYEVQAKAPEGSTKEQIAAMLRTLLMERFGLKLHKQIREVAAYDLGLASSNPKITSAENVETGADTAIHRLRPDYIKARHDGPLCCIVNQRGWTTGSKQDRPARLFLL